MINRSKDGTVISLDSSWEEALATRLDYLNVIWERPNPIKWKDKDEKEHHYFPDFYLPGTDVFLDPKNPVAYNVQREKIEILKKQIPNLIFLTSLDECKSYSPGSPLAK